MRHDGSARRDGRWSSSNSLALSAFPSPVRRNTHPKPNALETRSRDLTRQLGANRELSDSLAGQREQSVSECGRGGRQARLTQTTKWRIAFDEVNVNLWRVREFEHGVIGKAALNDGTILDCDCLAKLVIRYPIGSERLFVFRQRGLRTLQ